MEEVIKDLAKPKKQRIGASWKKKKKGNSSNGKKKRVRLGPWGEMPCAKGECFLGWESVVMDKEKGFQKSSEKEGRNVQRRVNPDEGGALFSRKKKKKKNFKH